MRKLAFDLLYFGGNIRQIEIEDTMKSCQENI